MAEEQRFEAQEIHQRLCANNCGFFGNPSTVNLCSKCYRDHRLKEDQAFSTKIVVEKSFSINISSPVIIKTDEEVRNPIVVPSASPSTDLPTSSSSPVSALKLSKCPRKHDGESWLATEVVKNCSAVHKVFRASNVSKLLLNLQPEDRSEAAAIITFEASARMQDPVYGCVSHVFALQQQEEIEYLEAQFAGDHSAKLILQQDSPVLNNTNCGVQFISERDPNFCSQQPSDRSYSAKMMNLSNEKSLQCAWRGQSSSFDARSESSSLGNLTVGIDHTNFLCDLVLEDYSSMYAMYY